MLTKLPVPLLLVLPTVLLNAHPSSVTLKPSAATVEYGHPVTLTAVVSPSTATGHVAFYRGVEILETEPLSNGSATFTDKPAAFWRARTDGLLHGRLEICAEHVGASEKRT